MSTEVNQAYNYSMQIKYDCKELITKSFYDPVLSSELIEFLYNFIKRKRNVCMTNFAFNDVEKFIDITFDMEKSVNKDFNAVCYFINDGFRNLYRQWTLGNDFFRLWSIDSVKAEEFRDTVINDIDSIASSYFTLFSSILCMKVDEHEMVVRIKLV